MSILPVERKGPEGLPDHPELETSMAGKCQLDHFAVLVREDQMERAVEFFTRHLRWVEDEKAFVEGDWGHARFVIPKEGPLVRVQLTELRNEFGEKELPGVHVGIAFKSPKVAALEANTWAHERHIVCVIEEIPGGKFFVSLPTIFRVEFEFVPLRPAPQPTQ